MNIWSGKRKYNELWCIECNKYNYTNYKYKFEYKLNDQWLLTASFIAVARYSTFLVVMPAMDILPFFNK